MESRKIYIPTKHGLKYDCCGRFTHNEQDAQKWIASGPEGWYLQEATIEFK